MVATDALSAQAGSESEQAGATVAECALNLLRKVVPRRQVERKNATTWLALPDLETAVNSIVGGYYVVAYEPHAEIGDTR